MSKFVDTVTDTALSILFNGHPEVVTTIGTFIPAASALNVSKYKGIEVENMH